MSIRKFRQTGCGLSIVEGNCRVLAAKRCYLPYGFVVYEVCRAAVFRPGGEQGRLLKNRRKQREYFQSEDNMALA